MSADRPGAGEPTGRLATLRRRLRLPAPSRSRPRLDQPVELRRPLLHANYDPDSFGRASESIARFLGTGRFLVYMTAVVLVWIGWNAIPAIGHFDGYPFIFLTLVLSLQASYAAPLILLAQNRQDDRDRINLDADRRTDAQTRADMDFLAREVASLRVAVGEVATRDYVRSEVRSLVDNLTELLERTEGGQPARKPRATGAKGKDKARSRKVADQVAHQVTDQVTDDNEVGVTAT